MELLVTLRSTKNIDIIKNACDGFIVGSLFSSGYNYSIDDLKQINKYCKNNNIKLYVTIENFINEEDTSVLINYLELLKELNVDGIYFHDLGVYDVARKLDMLRKLIYDGQTIVCNSLDVAFYMARGINGVVLSRELTLEELTDILKNNNQDCDVMIFGHQRLSYSRRKFLTNYFKEIKENYNFRNKQSLRLIEEQRDYKLPIIEDLDGTRIYSDYVFEMFNEISDLKQYIKRGIVDTLFINEESISEVLRDYKRITKDNAAFLFNGLKMNYPDDYSTGYLYQKTNITKDE